jgi:hypothetical protein
MSQAFTLGQDTHLISIPFIKFSHSTSLYGTRNFIWSHIQRDDLDLVVRYNRVIDEQGNCTTRVVMRIIAGKDVLVRLAYNRALVKASVDLT